MVKCKDCKHFEQAKWHKAIDPDESPQYGGYCDKLLKILQITNSRLVWVDKLHVQEEFGCVIGKRKEG